MIHKLLLFAIVLLIGCSGPREIVVIEPVEVRVPVPAHAEPPEVERPILALEGLTEHSTPAEVAHAYATSLLLLIVYGEALEHLLDAYRSPDRDDD